MGESRNYTPIWITVAMAAGLFFGAKLSGLQEKYGIAGSDSPKLETVRKLVSRYYFEDLDADSLTDRMVIAMLETLDPHSSYMNARDMREHEAEMMGEFEGIGITFNILNDTITVVSVVPGGPSQHGGLSAADRIVTIDGENVAGVKIQNSEVIRKLRGPKGTKVRVGVVSPVLDYPLQMEIVRDKIPLHSVDVAYMIAPGIGYVQIHSFSATTGKEFSNALDFLNSQGMKKLVLDLRGNPGGALQSAVEVCDELLEQRKVIVSTRGKSIGEAVYRATAAGDFQREDQELVVLIDEWSASAAEIVAGAVQDQDRGLIIGRRSFGKG
ncbi:MAG: PDZ domain-containing protein, partial [Bacteroidales bacterium]|nr:PDZ domain-containing protein [Bacteroidales bacterium]